MGRTQTILLLIADEQGLQEDKHGRSESERRKYKCKRKKLEITLRFVVNTKSQLLLIDCKVYMELNYWIVIFLLILMISTPVRVSFQKSFTKDRES